MAESKTTESRLFERIRDKAASIAGDNDRMSNLVSASKEKLQGINFDNTKITKLGNNLRIIIRMIQAYANGSYRELPWKSLLALIGGVVYFMMPLDLMPDFIPFTGLLDDFTVIMLLTSAFQQDIKEFLLWEETKK